MLVFVILVEMKRKLRNSASQKGNLNLRGAGVSVVEASFSRFSLLLPFREHRQRVSYSAVFYKGRPF